VVVESEVKLVVDSFRHRNLVFFSQKKQRKGRVLGRRTDTLGGGLL
jgi:hypothetical protein